LYASFQDAFPDFLDTVDGSEDAPTFTTPTMKKQ
jgi:hypothetical protein